MTIEELIQSLQEIKKNHGDMELAWIEPGPRGSVRVNMKLALPPVMMGAEPFRKKFLLLVADPCERGDELTERRNVLVDVAMERTRQDSKWGEQNHDPFKWLAILMEEVGEASKAHMEAHWRGLNPGEYRKEMVQVAAVAVAAVESFDRNNHPFFSLDLMKKALGHGKA